MVLVSIPNNDGHGSGVGNAQDTRKHHVASHELGLGQSVSHPFIYTGNCQPHLTSPLHSTQAHSQPKPKKPQTQFIPPPVLSMRFLPLPSLARPPASTVNSKLFPTHLGRLRRPSAFEGWMYASKAITPPRPSAHLLSRPLARATSPSFRTDAHIPPSYPRTRRRRRRRRRPTVQYVGACVPRAKPLRL
ncbi:hypothetical protein BS50DRAFT_232551 [Corynespora cassiicola Philippines]|uniref:Uncharacterized protein n=1 Tax=Corynespora cassiicola Philippines TaxID=1448308 RepID=A0A2T2P2S5_CORCC|nr:hypothetical protein BS50DRAFT_232551 [Corynespora cassiicola Philippines]